MNREDIEDKLINLHTNVLVAFGGGFLCLEVSELTEDDIPVIEL